MPIGESIPALHVGVAGSAADARPSSARTGGSSSTASRPTCARPASARGAPPPGPRSKGAESVTVAVRARPLSKDEGEAALRFTPTTVTVSPGKNEQAFSFDSVYDGEATQQSIYTDLGAPLLRKALEGFNGTIFAYGQTGSGKTFTMSGGHDGGPLGIVPLLGDELFFLVDQALAEEGGAPEGGAAAEAAPRTKFLLTVSYLEIYNELCIDLLAPELRAAPGRPAGSSARPAPAGGREASRELSREAVREPLEIKEHPTLGVFVKGLSEMPVRSRAELMALLSAGGSRRATGETAMNARSSRSHAIMTLHVRQQRRLEPLGGSGGGGDSKARTVELSAKINLVDLAGTWRMHMARARSHSRCTWQMHMAHAYGTCTWHMPVHAAHAHDARTALTAHACPSPTRACQLPQARSARPRRAPRARASRRASRSEPKIPPRTEALARVTPA